MRIVLAIAFCVAVAWGMSSFFASNTPALKSAAQNVDHAKVRQALINAADWLESSPCDPKYKEPLRQALIAYIADAQTTTEAPDGEIKAIAEGALRARVVSMGEIAGFGPLVWRDEKTTFQSVDMVKHRRFACNRDDNASDPWEALRTAVEAQRAQQPTRLPMNAGR